ncbi:hypothetical protein SPRG_09086 [Saprolegnia parasitica CBS 223.65]|uniref:Uncharacterized protein n=1 Tax=Saprolegnia parasitica (strain CBS 223.65) TaxID=695850 RepID=A0A067C9F9_SAPPC|nr:hypothetical protein SPRG_09086 [Saprolegnia parasitica CBS 223.65]KDO25790.1 hypothetical protein SPRG_09086 [Saprolegnia parasitica CBS 223.65]|eukprot:XP_012203594.1 hypothetical protein SPRG_09086 [Saprolegnia parasitica CBS 223.65]
MDKQTPMKAVDAGALALPRHALDAPLAAQQTLWMAPSAFRNSTGRTSASYSWTDYHNEATVLTALPTFRSIRIRHLGGHDEELRDLGNNEREVTSVAFAAKRGHKVTRIDVTPWLEVRHNTALTRVCGLCTGLVSLAATVTIESDATILTAVIHAARHVKPHRMGFFRFTCDDDVDMGHCFAATTSLTSLKLQDSPRVIEGLVAASVPLPNITELRLHSSHADILKDIVTQRINHPRLRVLELAANYDADATFALALLPQLSALEELLFDLCT